MTKTATVSRRSLLRGSVAAAALLGAGASTACTSGGDDELVFGHFGAPAQIALHAEITELFRRRYPEIRVRETYADPAGFFAKLPLLFRSGAAPDVFMAAESWITGLAELGGFADLAPRMTADALTEDQWLPGSFGAVAVGERRLGLPLSVFAKGIGINLSLFDQQGITPPRAGWSEAEFLELAERLTLPDGTWGTRQFFGGGASPPYDLPTLYGGMIFDFQTRQMSASTPEVVNAVAFVDDLLNGRQVAPPSSAGAALANGLPTGQFAMDGFAAYQTTVWTEQVAGSFEWDVVPYPTQWRGTYQNTNVAVFAGSPRQEAAWLLAKFVATDPEAQRLLGEFATPTYLEPARAWIADPPPAFTGIDWQPLIDRLPEQGVAYQGGSFNKVWSVMNRENQRVQLQGADPAEAMAVVDQRGTEILGV